MTPAEFTVYQFFIGGQCAPATEPLKARTALREAKELTATLGARIGSTCRIVITDAGGGTVWEWRYGHGVVFPRED